MLTLTRARKSASAAGTPLPTVFDSWARNGVHIRQSQLHLIAAAPGVGKSLVSLSIALKAGVPAYYFSADSDEFTTYVRAAAMAKGWRTQDIENAIRQGHTLDVDALLDDKAKKVRFNFNPSPDLDDLDQELQAFAAAYGEYPSLVVVDNLRNLYDPDGGDHNDLCEFLKVRARETKAAFIALHHVTGEYDDGIRPVPLSGLIGKISKIPELIITLDRNPAFEQNGVQFMQSRPVKNRGGRADPSGQWSIPLAAEMDRMRLSDIPYNG